MWQGEEIKELQTPDAEARLLVPGDELRQGQGAWEQWGPDDSDLDVDAFDGCGALGLRAVARRRDDEDEEEDEESDDAEKEEKELDEEDELYEDDLDDEEAEEDEDFEDFDEEEDEEEQEEK